MAILRAGSGVLRRKPIEHIEEPEAVGGEQLTRVLGLWQLTAIGVGGIIGAGIFSLAGPSPRHRRPRRRPAVLFRS